MEVISAIGSWISERESLFSGAAALIVLMGVTLSAISLIFRRVRNLRSEKDAEATTAQAATITLQSLSEPAT